MSTDDNQSVETGESEVRVLNNSLVGSLRKCVLDDISHEVHNTFNFNPTLMWVEVRVLNNSMGRTSFDSYRYDHLSFL